MLAPVAIPGHAEVLWNVWLDIQSCNGLYTTDTVRLPSLGLLFSTDWECGSGTGCPYVWGPAPNLELDPLILLGKGILVLGGCPRSSGRRAGTCSCETCTVFR